MASFAYTAINAEGVELDGQINAPDLSAAREALRVRGLLALSLDQQAASTEWNQLYHTSAYRARTRVVEVQGNAGGAPCGFR